MMKLTYPQTRTLHALNRQTGWVSAYQLKMAMNALYALSSKGLAKSTSRKGEVFVKSKDIMWRITDKGRQALKGGE